MTQQTAEQEQGRGKGRAARLIAAGLVIAAAGAAWWFFLSPQARVKKNVREMAAAFEARDADGVLEHFSADYSDAAGNTYDDMDAALRDFVMPLIEEPDITIQSIAVSVDRGTATALARGTILYKIKGMPQREKFEEDNPAVLVFEREGRAWRVVSVENIGENLDTLRESFDSIKGVF